MFIISISISDSALRPFKPLFWSGKGMCPKIKTRAFCGFSVRSMGLFAHVPYIGIFLICNTRANSVL